MSETKKETRIWWKKTGLRFSCKECGACCGGEPGNIWVSDEDVKAIAEYLKMTRDEFASKYLRYTDGCVSIKDLASQNYDCVFLNHTTKKCTIYPVRPRQCAEYPFWDSMLKDKDEWMFYADRCPGMNCGKLWTEEEIKEFRDNL